jgi:hypothetical protein
MAVPTDYISGTITLTNGSTAFTGNGTGWLAADFREGDLIIWIEGGEDFSSPIIQEILTNTSGTLTSEWVGPTLTNVSYRMRYQWDSSRVSAQSRQLIEQLGNGNITSFSALEGPGIPFFNGPHTMTIRPESDFINGVYFNAQVDDLDDRAAYDGMPGPNGSIAGFAVLVNDVGDAFGPENNGRSAVFSKLSDASGDWSGPGYLTGGPPEIEATVETLPTGSTPVVNKTPIPGGFSLDFELPAAEGFQAQGSYDDGEEYNKGDVVLHFGSSWIARITTTGNAPPTLPTVENTWWTLLAAKGNDGAGTVATIVEGEGINVDLTDPTSPIISVDSTALSSIVTAQQYGSDLSGDPTSRALAKTAWQAAVAQNLPFVVPVFADGNPLIIQIPEDFANEQVFTNAVASWIIPQALPSRGTQAHLIKPSIQVQTLGMTVYDGLNWTYNLPNGMWESIEFKCRNAGGYTLVSETVLSGPVSNVFEVELEFSQNIPLMQVGNFIHITLPVASTHTGAWRLMNGAWPIKSVNTGAKKVVIEVTLINVTAPDFVHTLTPGQGIFVLLNGGIDVDNLPANGADIGGIDVHYGIRLSDYVVRGRSGNSSDSNAVMGRYGAQIYATRCAFHGFKRAGIRSQNGRAVVPNSSFTANTWGINSVGSQIVGNSYCKFSGNSSQGFVAQQKSGAELTQPAIHGNGGQGALVTNESSILFGGGAAGAIEFNNTGIEVDPSSYINRGSLRIANNVTRAWLVRKGGRMSHTNLTDVSGTQSPPAATYGMLQGGGFNLITDSLEDTQFFSHGTFVPTMTIGGSSTGITYNAPPVGRWQIDGDWIDVAMYLRLTSKGGLTGEVAISNMPQSHITGLLLSPTGNIQFVSLASAIASLTGRLASNSQIMTLFKSGAVSVVALNGTDLTDTTQLYIHIRYPFR